MKSFLTDSNNDLYINNVGNIAMGEDLAAVVQCVQNALLTVKGEIEYDITIGIPYFDTIFVGEPNISLWEGLMVEEAEKVDGVIRVESMESTVENNILTYKMTILTKYGNATITG